MNKYLQFKKLLEYFVSHLEWIENKDDSFKGFPIYIKSLVDDSTFKMTGQGYDGAGIQNQVENWDKYDLGKICINIQGNYGSYQSVKCYLNWLDTGINVLAEWKNKKIVGLYQDEFLYWEKPTRRVNLNIKYSLNDLKLFEEGISDELILFFNSFENSYKGLLQRENLKKLMKQTMENKKIIEYKKQIILQGPPGTGKTREAKLLARTLIDINSEYVINNIAAGQLIHSAKGNVTYKVLSIANDKIEIEREKGTTNSISISQVINAFEEQKWNNDITNNDDRMAVAVAKYLFDNFFSSNEQFKLIQFHPSYTYEDFVRGIVSKPNEEGDGILYEAENKTIGKFAKQALRNYIESNISHSKTNDETDFDNFVAEVLRRIDEEGKYMISDKVYIYFTDNNRFKYKGDNWTAHPNGLNMNFSELKKIIRLGLNSRQEINKSSNLNALTRQHATYYQNLIELYKKHVESQPTTAEKSTILQNYVLIIDEINRANLSSVLGELIYALEYRGAAVESMYEVDGSTKLILPPNLYIIGTMNTADRSVGHIDYAIRRRFAFVDVLPKQLNDNDEIYFNIKDFESVSKLFVEGFISAEFDVKDVKIGHSYFIAKKEDAEDDVQRDIIFRMKMDYEIKPILREYLKDGIFNSSKKIGELSIKEYIESL